MERLTKRASNGMAYLVKVKPNEQDVESPYPNTLKAIMESFNRLAEYEETELTPCEVMTIKMGVTLGKRENVLLQERIIFLEEELEKAYNQLMETEKAVIMAAFNIPKGIIDKREGELTSQFMNFLKINNLTQEGKSTNKGGKASWRTEES